MRYFEDKPEGRYRVLRWAPDPADRQPFEHLPTLKMADMAVTFIESEPQTGGQALTTKRNPKWARFERWFWSQAPDDLVRDFLPTWGRLVAGVANGHGELDCLTDLQLRDDEGGPHAGS